MPGPLPKPAGARLRTNAPTFAEVVLPAEGRLGAPPPLPPLTGWHAETVAAWSALWATPQATRWDQTGRSLHRWALLYEQLMRDPASSAATHAQLVALEDRHGLSPSAMAKLRWRIDDAPAPATTDTSAPAGKSAKAARLRAVAR